ncbi:MAG: aminotransferase class V-fold PLP-dependent enzyme [Saprospiraceae bacterium]|nr:aminotransferase class V-fold PLP-dependent enzyme [Saprospiraceae bacterium]
MGIIHSQRELFDIPDQIAYFNCAYYSPLLLESTKRLHFGVDSKKHPWERVPADFFKEAEIIRELSCSLFGGDVDGFAVIPSVSYGMSTVGRILETNLKKGDRVLIVAEEFPSIVFPLQRAAKEIGIILDVVDTPIDGNWTAAILNNMDHSVKAVALSSCHWTNGALIDLVAIRHKCDEINAILMIDATQTLGVIPFSINEIKPDFLIAAGYKWLLGPYGFSLFYIDQKWRNERPLEETWIGRENAEDFANLVNYSDVYMSGSRRFEMGEKCTPTILPGVIAALEQIKTWGIPNIAQTLLSITQRIELNLDKLGFQLLDKSQRSPHILGARIPDAYTGNLVAELKTKNIYISQRSKSIRIAPHLYINDRDIERLNQAMNELLH